VSVLAEHVHSRRYVFSLQLNADSVVLAAEDEASRQCCVRALGAAINGASDAFMKDVASTAAFTPHLIGMKNLSIFNHVAVLLGKPAASGLDAKSLKQAGFGPKELEAMGFRRWDIIDTGYIATDYTIVSCALACSCHSFLSLVERCNYRSATLIL
jgi:hypothetical protein